jgi:vitamin B12/bleomycin/antimicrobial peptide transport system ATP-binding/permease protein
VLLQRPRWVFLDEATAALDEANQDAMMELLREELPEAAVVSIGHRPGLDRYHDRVLVLEPSPEGAVLAAPDEPEGEERTGPTRSGGGGGGGRKPAKAGGFLGPLRAVARRFR